MEYKYNKMQEKIVDILVSKTGNEDRSFFRVMVAYKFSELASNMRCTVEFAGTSNIPVNMYALDLAPSGYSKNASMNVLEKEIFKKFKDKFMNKMLPDISSFNLEQVATDYSMIAGLQMADSRKTIDKEYNALPKFIYQFGASTPEDLRL